MLGLLPISAAPISALGGVAFALSCAAGVFNQTGEAASLNTSRKVSAAVGTFVQSGQVARQQTTRASGAASFVLTGYDATVETARVVYGNATSYSLTGEAASINTQRVVVSDSGAFMWTGYPNLYHTSRYGGVGLFTYAGLPAGLAVSYDINPIPMVFYLTGQAALLSSERYLRAYDGAYAVTGHES